METKEMIYAEEITKRGYDIEMVCENGKVSRIRAGRMVARRKETIDYLPIQIC